MARSNRDNAQQRVQEGYGDYRHDNATRKNNPPSGMTGQGQIEERPTIPYSYDPHLPPVLRFDTGNYADILKAASSRRLEQDEIDRLTTALGSREPWLEWTGKREQTELVIDPVALHIHERVSAKAIMAVAARQDVQRSFFADPQQEYREAVQFYEHDVAWSNRLILGDSLDVMSSLAHREALAGQVQMIYMDPPYGIRYASNFQPRVGHQEVKDRPQDLTREPEVVKAYRDTWTLGTHSYLSYLRNRLIVARTLLRNTGSVFLQIGEENIHLVRTVMDEVFGRGNFISLISYATTGGFETTTLSRLGDYILWYAKSHEAMTYQQLFVQKSAMTLKSGDYRYIEFDDKTRRLMDSAERSPMGQLPLEAKVFRLDNTTSQGEAQRPQPLEFEGRIFSAGPGRHWKAQWPDGMNRLAQANRLYAREGSVAYVRYLDDFRVIGLSNMWGDTSVAGTKEGKLYAVQTNMKVIERCLLMTTDPGDLVLDPTCGSGTAAYVAEQWGRRWITIDTSRVALAIARQRLLTSTFDYYQLQDEAVGPASGFHYKTVPHITLKSIAQNVALDPIFAKNGPILAAKLDRLNTALTEVTPEARTALAAKLAQKERAEGRRAITDADRRRWLLPKERWQEWEAPFDTDPDWPLLLQEALNAYREAWRVKMDEVNATIAASAEQEELVDQPEMVRGVTRVSGPFTVESVLPPEERLDAALSPVDNLDEELPAFGDDLIGRNGHANDEPANADAYLDKMLRLLRTDGVRFPNNKHLPFTRLAPVLDGQLIHAEGEWSGEEGDTRYVAVSFGPQYGPVTAKQVEECLWSVGRRGYHDLIFAGFSFDAAAQATIQGDPHPRTRIHLAHIRPDVNMGDLLKQTPNSQLFTVFGLPRTRLDQATDGHWTVTMEGVDIYDPVNNEINSTGAEKVAAWFLDSDYDGRTFCVCQAFFPDKDAWTKITRDLKSVIDADAFAAFSGTTSLPFATGEHGKAAIKVIDPRGNEVLRVHALTPERVYG